MQTGPLAPPGSCQVNLSGTQYFLKFRTVWLSLRSHPLFISISPLRSIHQLTPLSSPTSPAICMKNYIRSKNPGKSSCWADRPARSYWVENWGELRHQIGREILFGFQSDCGWLGDKHVYRKVVTMKWINPTLFNFQRQWMLSAVYQVADRISSWCSTYSWSSILIYNFNLVETKLALTCV